MGGTAPEHPIGSEEDAVAFLRQGPPFDDLTDDLLRRAAAGIRTERFPPGTSILEEGRTPAGSLYVIRSGAVEINEDGQLVDLPSEGEVFGELSLLSGLPPTATVRAHDDLVCYTIDRERALEVLGQPRGLTFVHASMRRRLARALGPPPSTAIRIAVEEAKSTEEAIEAAGRLPHAVCDMVEDGTDATAVSRLVGSTVDALTRRLLELGIEEIGQPPVPWAWLALGSQARQEQALHTDQDHALAYDPQDAEHDRVDRYFADLAERVTAGLEAAGIPRCTGDAMAVNPDLRRPIQEWVVAYREWMADPGVTGSILSSVAFDFRRVAGPLDADGPLDREIETAAERYPQFVRHLARRALDKKPPTGFFKDLVVEGKGEHAGRLDVKRRGVTLLANLARAYAVRARRPEKRTLERLTAARQAGQIDEEARRSLEEALRLLWQTRLEHQARQVRAGQVPDDHVDPRSLGPVARVGLKEAFKIVMREQKSLAADLGVSY